VGGMSNTKHTPGPWKAERTGAGHILRIYPPGDDEPPICGQFVNYSAVMNEANARLMALAPDHATVAAALATGTVRWELFTGDNIRGEICVGGLRYATHLDEWGVPVLSENTRTALAKAKGTA